MKPKNPEQVLVQSFLVLTDAQLLNLKYHLGAKTRICCGAEAFQFTDGKGGG